MPPEGKIARDVPAPHDVFPQLLPRLMPGPLLQLKSQARQFVIEQQRRVDVVRHQHPRIVRNENRRRALGRSRPRIVAARR